MNKIRVLIGLRPDTDIFEEMKNVHDMGCECCQIKIWHTLLYTDEMAANIVKAAKEYDVEISTLWAGWSYICFYC